MRLLWFVLLMAATLYAAAMYQYPPLLLLFLVEILLAVLLFWLTVYFKKHVILNPKVQQGMIEKGEDYWYENKIQNKGRLPTGKLRLKVYCSYWQRPTVRSCVNLYGSSDCGEGEIRFRVMAPYCGLLLLSLDKLIVYDYLSLFALSRTMKQYLRLAVLPRKKSLQIKLAEKERARAYQKPEIEEKRMWSPENTYGEIRQIREYREGDSLRHIHWNQSARTDTLWVREYEAEQETERQVELLLEPKPSARLSPGKEFLEGMDAFYELTFALLLGLLQENDRLQVHWYEEEREVLIGMEAVTEEDCQEILLKLYQLPFQMGNDKKEEKAKKTLEHYQTQHLPQGFFRLTSDLCWYYKNILLYQFSREKLEEEINGRVFEV